MVLTVCPVGSRECGERTLVWKQFDRTGQRCWLWDRSRAIYMSLGKKKKKGHLIFCRVSRTGGHDREIPQEKESRPLLHLLPSPSSTVFSTSPSPCSQSHQDQECVLPHGLTQRLKQDLSLPLPPGTESDTKIQPSCL